MENMYYLIDLERTTQSGQTHYWKQSKHGYTRDINEAGKFSEQESNKLVTSDFDKLTVRINTEDLSGLSDPTTLTVRVPAKHLRDNKE